MVAPSAGWPHLLHILNVTSKAEARFIIEDYSVILGAPRKTTGNIHYGYLLLMKVCVKDGWTPNLYQPIVSKCLPQ